MSESEGGSCPIRKPIDTSKLEVVELQPVPSPADYRQAMALANEVADGRFGELGHMLLSWYDRDRDFESPQHSSECHEDSAIPGYVDYALYRDARLKVDIEAGRFVFFYLELEM